MSDGFRESAGDRLRVLRVNPVGNDPRHRQRELALAQLGGAIGMVVPDRPYVAEWSRREVEPHLPYWPCRLYNAGSIPLHLWGLRGMRRAVKAFDPQILDVHEEPSVPAAGQAALVARGRPLVLHADQNIARRYPLPIVAVRKWTFERTAAVYASSTEAVDVLRRWGFRGITEVIPYGIEDEFFDARPHGDRIGFVGRFVEAKGILDLLPLGSRLLCIGDGPLAPVVRQAGAEVRRAATAGELRAALEEMAVLAMPSLTTPSWKEQFGRTAAEAMAAGVPVVAYASGAIPEVLGQCGVLVPEGDAPALLAAIEAVLAAPGDMAVRARQRAKEQFVWGVVAQRTIELYGRVLEAG
jgi:glycosyltransferase involved in cell wall biosynthesis